MKNVCDRLLGTIISINGKIRGHPYASKHSIRSWINYIILYFKVRVFGSTLRYNWVNRLKIVVDVNDWGFARNTYLRLNEFVDSCFAVHFLRKSEIFLDIGANLGHYSLLVSAISGARVIAYEPMPDTYNKFISNIKINNLEKMISAFNIGIGSSKGELSFKHMRNNVHCYISNSSYDTIKVDMMSLDSLIFGRCPTLVKIDVEGFEYKVLKGAKNILKNKSIKALIVEINNHCNRYGDTIEKTYNYITNFGFKPYYYYPLLRKVKKINIKKRKSENIIFLRSETNALIRLVEGNKIIFDNDYSV